MYDDLADGHVWGLARETAIVRATDRRCTIRKVLTRAR
jgi:hypothetical protein